MRNSPIRRILENCADIEAERWMQYGGITDNFGDAAVIANVLTSRELDARDVALVMLAVKLARIGERSDHADSYDDAINYLAIARVLGGIPLPPPPDTPA
ncbi:hypothetical protein GCM10019059_32400 [Camelimonas fluminis]|uniref:DUF6378 domain-containing protein n=1 Tax=Camelimonas fluminis TaxID=1576911 RepID=A0ABV7UJ90_9HYPH|nr:DUF6378 domain-containing protein [Camelimonas fluminis]GHE70101.1 hypothetical protein GCM10019059_32400 [Camelimonas fluminis]